MNNNQPKSKTEKEIALYYINALADTVREPFLILNSDLRVLHANDFFYRTFKTTKGKTEQNLVYNLGNKQWDIPELRQLLEKVLPQKKAMNNFEVRHNFPTIGLKTILLNAKQIDTIQLIILAFEDISAKKDLEKKAVMYTKNLEAEVAKQTADLKNRVKDLERLTKLMVGREIKMSELKKEITRVKKLQKPNNHNGE